MVTIIRYHKAAASKKAKLEVDCHYTSLLKEFDLDDNHQGWIRTISA